MRLFKNYKGLLCLLLTFGILFTSCNDSKNEPKAALTSFLDALSKKDITSARKYATQDSKSMLDFMETAMKLDSNAGGNKLSELKVADIEFEEAKYDGDYAIIETKIKSKKESIKFGLKKENKEWKVVFDMAFLINSAMDAMKKEGSESLDKLNKSIEQLKGINADSLAHSMEAN